MSYVLYCDLCNNLIKEGDSKFTFSILETITENLAKEEEQYYNNQAEYLQNLMSKVKKRKEEVKVFEICKNCKRILDHFISLRVSRARKIYEIIKNIDKKSMEGASGNV